MTNGAQHDLRLGVLEEAARHRGHGARAVLARVEAAGGDAAAERPAVEMRHEPAGGAQQGRLAAGRGPGHDDELAGLDDEVDVAQGLTRSIGVGVFDALEGQQGGYRSIPRRSAKGRSATSAMARHSAISAGPTAACSRG